MPTRRIFLPLRPLGGGYLCRPHSKPRQVVRCNASAGAAAVVKEEASKDANSGGIIQRWKAWWKLDAQQQGNEAGERDTKSGFVPLAKKMISLCKPDFKLFVLACIFMVRWGYQ